jgi:hypothetical protein
MSSVSRPGKGETGKTIFHEGGHDEHQHDNADDTPLSHMLPLPIMLCILASFIRRPLPRSRRHRPSVGVLIDVTEQFDFGRVPDKI